MSGSCHEGCDAPVEWRCDALDEDGQVIRSLFACGDGEDLAQQIFRALVSSGRPAVSVNVMQWAGSYVMGGPTDDERPATTREVGSGPTNPLPKGADDE